MLRLGKVRFCTGESDSIRLMKYDVILSRFKEPKPRVLLYAVLHQNELHARFKILFSIKHFSDFSNIPTMM